MPSVYITTPGAKASLVSERLRVSSPDPETGEMVERDIPLHDVEQVLVAECCNLTTAALADLLRRRIPVAITSPGSRLLGLCMPPAPHSVARMEQYRSGGDPAFCLALAVPCVEAKILNQRRVLQRLAVNRDADAAITDGLRSLMGAAQRAVGAASLETLRGYEGAAAGCYFNLYSRFFPDDCPFERRSRRPPLNAPNAILSYAYTLLAGEAEAFLYAVGLDPVIGFYHAPEDGRPSLALDIIEPFRAPLADAMALDTLTHRTLKPAEHFERKKGGIFLNPEGRRRFHVAYERRMERLFTSEQHLTRTSLRAELHSQCRAVKKAFLEGEPYLPFLMN